MESQWLLWLSHLVDLPVCPPFGPTGHTNTEGWLLRAAPPAASAREPRPSVLRRFPKPAARCCTRDPRFHAQLAGSVSTASTSSDPGPLWTITKPPIGPAPPGRHSRGEGREARSQEPGARSRRRRRRRFCPRAALQLCISRLASPSLLTVRASVPSHASRARPKTLGSHRSSVRRPLHSTPSLPPQQAANPLSPSRSPSEAHRLHSQALADSAIGSAVAAATCPPAAPADAWLPLQPGHGLASCDLRRLSPFSTGRRSSPIVLCTRFLYVWSIVALPFFQCSQPVSGTLLFFFFESFSRPPGCQRYTLDAPPAYETIACSHLPRCPQIFPAPDALLTEGQSTACSGYPISALSDVLLSAFGSQPGSLLNDSAARGQPSLRGGG